MKLTVDAQPARKGATVVRFFTREDCARFSPPVSKAEFSGEPGSVLHERAEGVVRVGIGEVAKLDAYKFRVAAGAAAMFLRKIGRTEFSVDLQAWPQFAGAAVDGLVTGSYRFERFQNKKGANFQKVHVHLHRPDIIAAKDETTRGLVVANAVNLARAVADEPGNVLYPATLAERARKIAHENRLKVTILDERQLRAKRFGGLLAVGGGSARGPRLIVLEHRGGAKSEPPLALVGKAITFDSGGISIKPAADMESMIFDKCGGMAVLGAMAGIAELGLKRNVVGIIPTAENLPSGTAYRPGDIVTTYDGKHIEIVNTDAEGRVVLADAIAFARIDCKARAIVDLATLTGACTVALGEQAAGLWTNDEALRDEVLAASDRAAERLWPMPLYPEYAEQIRSDVAVVKNSGGRLGGACTAAAFLMTFAEATPWAHLDIAGVANRTRDRSWHSRGATGFGVRTLIDLVENWRAK